MPVAVSSVNLEWYRVKNIFPSLIFTELNVIPNNRPHEQWMSVVGF